MLKRRQFLPYLTLMREERGVSKARLATVWLDGCSGCHMSFLDMDERLLLVAEKADLVYSPLVDTKEFPDDVDIALVEGAVSSEEDLHKIQMVRGKHENTGLAGRLCGDRQCSRHAQSVRHQGGVCPGL